MEILSCSLLVCRALSAQWRSVGAVAPERVVASFLCSRLVSCTCALLWTFILTHATALKPFHSKQSYPLHHLQQGYAQPLFVLMLDAEIGEADAAAAAQQTPIPVEVNVPVVPELSLVELTQVWTLGFGSDRSLGRPKEWNGEPSGYDDFAFKFSNWLSGLPGDAERFLEESVTMAQPIQWATLTPREKVVARGVAM